MALAAVPNRYRRDLKRDYERLEAFDLSNLETPFGRVEYAQAGEGPAVLVVHGVFGGYDFGVGWMTFEKWARRTRATSEEKHKRLPGDELVPRPMWQATRAITIHAPRNAVWPWLVQMGYPTHRAGWYTPYWMDRVIFRIRAQSADCIIPELQNLAPGDRVPDSPDGVVSYFTVAEITKGRALVLISHTHPLPIYRDVDFSWAFVLDDDGIGADTRLIMRARVADNPVGPGPIIRSLVAAGFGIGDIVQVGGMLGGIKVRAESAASGKQERPGAQRGFVRSAV